MTLVSNGGTTTLGLYDTQSQLEKKADITYVDNKVDPLIGGHKGFATLALAQAAQGTLPSGSVVEVTNDATASNNGLYLWNGADLTKSNYDPLTQAKGYTDAKILSSGLDQANDGSLAVAIIDSQDNRTWLEAGYDGKPTDYSSSIILEKLNPSIPPAIAAAGIDQTSTSPNTSVAIVDSQDNRTWLEADGAGNPTPYAAQCINAALNLGDIIVPSKFKSSYQQTERTIVSGKDVVCWGDSLTAGSGGNGTTYPNVLKTLLQNSGSAANTYNMGVGGETSPTICARQGGNPFIINVTGGIIPADTSDVTVTLEQINGEVVRPLLQGSTTWTGMLGNIAGTLNLVEPSGSSSSWQADNYYTFTRSTAGTQVTMNRPTAFYLDVATPRLGDIHVIWIGQNNPSSGVSRHIADVKAMIQRMQVLDKRFLVMPLPRTNTDTTTLADRNAYDSAMFAEFGRRFVSIRQYLCNYGLADANISPTAQDSTDIAAGIVPTSLRADSVHLNAQGYTVVANQIFNRLNELGWI